MPQVRVCHITKDVNPHFSSWFGGVPGWIKFLRDIYKGDEITVQDYRTVSQKKRGY